MVLCISHTGYKHGNGPELGSAALNNSEDLAYTAYSPGNPAVLRNTDVLTVNHNFSSEQYSALHAQVKYI